MEQHENDNIRWEKIEEKLEHPGAEESDAQFSDGEWNVLLLFKRLRAGVKPVDVEKSFPTGEGWSRLNARIAQSELSASNGNRKRSFFLIPAFRYAAAAMILLITGISLWMIFPLPSKTNNNNHAQLSTEKQKADLPASEQVQLILADGRKINVDQSESITESNGINITTKDGTISYQGSANPPLTAGNKIAYNSLVVPRGKKSHVILPDGSKVWVNAASKITYPTEFPAGSREVAVEGEAYFSVESDGKRPFVVHANDQDVKVLGTVFNVNSYERLLRTTLVSGKVKVSNSRSDQMLNPGEQAISDNVSGTMKTSKVNTKAFTAWKDGDIYLDDATLQDIMIIMERSFDYEIVFADNELQTVRFTIDLINPGTLQDVLDHISMLDKRIRFDVSGRKVIISKIR